MVDIYIVAGNVLHWSQARDFAGGGVWRTMLAGVGWVVLLVNFDSFSV